MLFKGVLNVTTFLVEMAEGHVCRSCRDKLSGLWKITLLLERSNVPGKTLLDKIEGLCEEQQEVAEAVAQKDDSTASNDNVVHVIEELVKEHNENEEIKEELLEELSAQAPASGKIVDLIKSLLKEHTQLKDTLEASEAREMNSQFDLERLRRAQSTRSLPLEIRI